jgi:hypothetical protein
MNKSQTSRLLGLVVLVIAVLLSTAGCSGSTGDADQQEVDIYVEALPNDNAEMTVPLPDGTLPCGLGQVEWGHQVFMLDSYPGCQSAFPSVTVYCLNDQAQWTNESIAVTEISVDTNTVTLKSEREGICGIFPQN